MDRHCRRPRAPRAHADEHDHERRAGHEIALAVLQEQHLVDRDLVARDCGLEGNLDQVLHVPAALRTEGPPTGATAREVEQQVTERLERTLQEVSNLDRLRSYTTAGTTVILQPYLANSRSEFVFTPKSYATTWNFVSSIAG